MKKHLFVVGALLCSLGLAQVKIGITLSITGPASGLGSPQKNMTELLPKYMGGKAVEYIVLDDASDPAKAVQNTKVFIERNVDAIIGSTISPNTLAMIDLAAEHKIPVISLGSEMRLISPMDSKRKWIFKVTPSEALMAQGTVNHMVRNKIKTVAYMSSNDTNNNGWYNALKEYATQAGIEVVADERYPKNSTQVTDQVARVLASKPDAVVIDEADVQGIVPQAALWAAQYSGQIYQTGGVAIPEFLRLGGKFVEEAVLTNTPLLVADQLPSNHPNRAVSLNLVRNYEKTFGRGSFSSFAGYLWDANLLLSRAVPMVLKNHRPGTPEFRSALRDALEKTRGVVGINGIFTMTPEDHMGLDNRSMLTVQVVDNQWKWLGQ